jgi:hypothetical protein
MRRRHLARRLRAQGSTLKARFGARVVPCALGLVLCALVSGVASGCAKAQAKTAPDGPPLSVPDPPARVLAPVEEAATPLPVAVETPAPQLPRPAAPRPPVRRPSTGNGGEPEPRPEPLPPAAAQTPPVPQPPALRAAPSAADAAAERAVRETLARATRDLGRVDYGRLSGDGRAQYEQSKRFSAQAEQALKDLNFPFAATLADKAATLAAELLGSR